MEKIAIIDLGSNSARLVLVNILEGGYFTVFDELKESVRLAQDMKTDNMLRPAKIAQTIKTLNMFKTLCVANKVEKIYAYATAAVRKAKNQRSFLEQVQASCGFRLEVLDADSEAHLVYQGVINSMEAPKGLIVDIGGGSTKIIYYNRRSIVNHCVIPFGAVNLYEEVKDKNLSQSERVEMAEKIIAEELEKIEWISEMDPEIKLIGVGGSFRNLGKISRILNKYPLEMTHNYAVTSSDFDRIYSMIKELDLDKIMKVKGLSSIRADIFPSALGIMNAIFSKVNKEQFVISGSGLREGVMFKYAVPSTNDKPITDVLGHSIYTILNAFDENIKHAEHVYNLCIQLFKQLKVLHKLPRFYVKVLRTAALLHDSGNRIKYYDHHKHSAYIILNSNLYGISHKDLAMAAIVASLHRKSTNGFSDLYKYKEMLTEEDYDAVAKLGVILRIAESFDRTMSGAITNITCDLLGDSVIMKTELAEIEMITNIDQSLEIKDAMTVAPEFKKAFKKNLQIQ